MMALLELGNTWFSRERGESEVLYQKSMKQVVTAYFALVDVLQKFHFRQTSLKVKVNLIWVHGNHSAIYNNSDAPILNLRRYL